MKTLISAALHGQTCSRLFATAIFLLFSFGVTAAQQPKAETQKQPPNVNGAEGRYWTTRWEFEDIDVRKLAGRLRAIGVDLGVQVRGPVTVRFDVGIPLTSLTDGAAYRFDGTLASPQLTIENVTFKDLSTTVTYRNGLATFTQLKSSIVDQNKILSDGKTGQIQGTGTVQLVPRKNATAELEVKSLSLAPFSELIAKFAPAQQSRLPQGGSLSGKIRFQTPLDSIDKIETYQLEGQVQCQQLKLAHLPPANVQIASVDIRDGRLRIGGLDLKAGSNARGNPLIRLMGKAAVPLNAQGGFSFELAGDDLPMGEIATLFSPSATSTSTIIDGKLDFRIKGNGSIANTKKDSTWKIDGSIASPTFRVAGVDMGVLEHNINFTPSRFDLLPRSDEESLPTSFKLERIQSEYRISEDALTLQSLNATAFGGEISGNATVPWNEKGDVVADFMIGGMRPRLKIPIAGASSASVSATLSGKINWRVPIAKLFNPDQHQGTAKLSAANISLGDESIGRLTASIAADQGRISLQGDGELLGGTIEVETLAEMEASDRWPDLSKRMKASKLRFEGVSIDPMMNLWVGRDTSAKASGELFVNFQAWSQEKSVLPPTSVSLKLSRLDHQSRLLSRKIRLTGRLEKDVFAIQSLTGDYASGSMRLSGRVYLFDSENALHPRADLRIAATRIQLDRGLWFIGDSAEQLRGRISLNATIAGYQESIRLRGNVEGRELAAYDIPIGTAHSALVANANLRSFGWDIKFPALRSSVGGGQLEGELFLASGRRGGVNLSSRWKTRRVDFFRLTNQLGRSSTLARGEISGELSLSGKSIRSIDDLAGRFDFRLGQTRGAAIPGLIAASQFLGPVSLASQTFDVGNARGIIGKGVVVVDEFWLGADNALIRADGKIYLRSGRMDLRALIATGDYRDIASNFAQLAQKYALRSLLPTSAILSVSELLRDRTLVIAVMGTSQSPIVRLRPIETFREESVRFLFREGQRLILVGITAEAAYGF